MDELMIRLRFSLQVGLGQLHFQGGRGISPDHHLALRYFQRAADGGSAVAMAFLGKMYLEGNDAVAADTVKALKWFQKAAELGSPVGQSGLGLMYLNGKGLPKDPSRALQYFTMAAEQGIVLLQNRQLFRV
jgi:SEL1 protein